MRFFLLSAALVATVGLSAQPTTLKPFQDSPAALVSQDLGISTVKIEYHRPSVKGRKLWGAVVPFGEVWRTGANEATRITFSDAVKIGDQDLPAGAYAFFAIPGAESWTLIFNKISQQWGAYDYKPTEDALRIQVKPTVAPFQEALSFAIQLASPERLRVEMGWDRLSVGFDVNLDVRGLYWAHLEQALTGVKPGEGAPFLQAATYCLNNNLHLDQGLAWVELAVQAKESARNLEVKAGLLRKAGRKAESLPCLQKAIDLATSGKAPKETLERLEKTKADWLKVN